MVSSAEIKLPLPQLNAVNDSACVNISGSMCSHLIFTKTEGESLSFGCSFNLIKGNKFFIKKKLSKERVLIKTNAITAVRGRYSIGYDSGIFYVSISQLNKSDSGHYGCGLGNSSSPELSREFELRVKEGELLLRHYYFLACRKRFAVI